MRDMKRPSQIDPENPPTQASDWIGAWVLQAGERRAPPVPGGVMFHIFRASKDPDLFAITDRQDPSGLPNCPGGEWRLFKVVPETGQRRVGFTEAAAKADILRNGYHLVNMQLTASDAGGRAAGR